MATIFPQPEQDEQPKPRPQRIRRAKRNIRRGLRAVLAFVGRVWRWLDLDARDAHVYGGLALVSWACWVVWQPAGAFAGGIGLMYLALRTPGGTNG